MANRVKFNAAGLREVSSTEKKRAAKARQAANHVNAAVNSRGWQCSEKRSIEQKLEIVRNNLGILASRMENLATVSAQTASRFEAVESKFNMADKSATSILNSIRNLIKQTFTFVTDAVKRLQEQTALLWQKLTNTIFRTPKTYKNIFAVLGPVSAGAAVGAAAIAAAQAAQSTAQAGAVDTPASNYLQNGGAYYGPEYLKTTTLTEEQRKYACWFCSYAMLLNNMGIKMTPQDVYDLNGKPNMMMNADSVMSSRLGVNINKGELTGTANDKAAQVANLLEDNPQGVLVYNSGHMSLVYKDEKGNILFNDPSSDKRCGVPVNDSWYQSWGTLTSYKTFS